MHDHIIQDQLNHLAYKVWKNDTIIQNQTYPSLRPLDYDELQYPEAIIIINLCRQSTFVPNCKDYLKARKSEEKAANPCNVVPLLC